MQLSSYERNKLQLIFYNVTSSEILVFKKNPFYQNLQFTLLKNNYVINGNELLIFFHKFTPNISHIYSK